MSSFTLRPDQRRALRALQRHFVVSGYTRGKYISACGTGKTVVLAHLPELLQARTVVFLVPSLNLVEQTWRAFDRQLDGAFDGFIVCSDDQRSQVVKSNPRKRHHTSQTVDKDIDDGDVQDLTDDQIVQHIGRGAVLRDPLEIAARLDQGSVLGQPTIVFCTYQSTHLLRAGIDLTESGQVDLVICDEAHRLVSEDVGKLRSGTVDARQYPPRVVLKLIKAKRFVFATATPKSSSKPGAYGMDDVSLFGKDAHVYTYAEAVLDGVVAPFDIVVSHLDADVQGAQDFVSSVSPLAKKLRPGDTAHALIHHEDVRSKVIARTLTALRAAGTVNRALTYSSSIKRAEQNARDIEAIAPGTAQAISSQTSPQQRIAGIAALEDGTVPVVTNCRLFGEGHDAPALDAVAFCDPKGSVVDIAQAIGRAARIPVDPVTGLPVTSKRALVIVPVDSFAYDQSGVLIRRSDGKGAINTQIVKDRSRDNPFAVVESVLAALDTPGVALHECAGDFEAALSNRHVFGRVEVTPRRMPTMDPDATTSNVRNHSGLSAEELALRIGPETPDELGRPYTEDEMLRAAPRVLTLDVLDPTPREMKSQQYSDAQEALGKYVKPEKIDKQGIVDFAIPATATALSVAGQYAAPGSLLSDEPAAQLWQAAEMLRTPVRRRAFAQLIAQSRRGSDTSAIVDGKLVFVRIDHQIALGIDAEATQRLIAQLHTGIAYAVHLSESGDHPGKWGTASQALPPQLLREAERAKITYDRRAKHGWADPSEQAIALFAGYVKR